LIVGFRQVQIQTSVQSKADVFVYSGLSENQVRDALLIPCVQIEKTISELMEKYGPEARICVIPEGPQTIPYID
jgi:lactate racemase